MWRSCCCCCCFFIRCACYPKYLLRCLIASSYGCLFIFCCCLHFICRCCCCYFVFASCRFRLMVSVRWAHHKGRWYFDWGEMPRVCNVSTEALLSWGQATVNHGAQKVKCLFTCDIGFIGHDSGSILFVYRIFRERKKSASDGIRMHFCVLVFSLLFFYFFFRRCGASPRFRLYLWIMCHWESRYRCSDGKWRRKKSMHTEQGTHPPWLLLHCSMNFNFGDDDILIFWKTVENSTHTHKCWLLFFSSPSFVIGKCRLVNVCDLVWRERFSETKVSRSHPIANVANWGCNCLGSVYIIYPLPSLLLLLFIFVLP